MFISLLLQGWHLLSKYVVSAIMKGEILSRVVELGLVQLSAPYGCSDPYATDGMAASIIVVAYCEARGWQHTCRIKDCQSQHVFTG